MKTMKCALLCFIHSYLFQTSDCFKHRTWKRWNEINVTFGTQILTLESVPLMICLLRCEETAGCASVHTKKGTSTCELSGNYPPDGNIPKTRTGWTVHYKVRAQTKTLSVINGGIWGEWGNPEYCPVGTFASGYIMKIEPKQPRGEDDTSLNAVRLICSDLGGIAKGHITSLEGDFGSWSQDVHCVLGTYLVKFQLQVELETEKKTDWDYSGANYVKFYCRDFAGHNNEIELVLPPGEGFWGSWGTWSETCDQNSAICGLSARVEGYQARDDDTALNDVLFYCCNDIN